MGCGRGILRNEASPLVTLMFGLAAPEGVIFDAVLRWTEVRAEGQLYRAMRAGGVYLNSTDAALMADIWPNGGRGDVHEALMPQRGPAQKQSQDDQCGPNERAYPMLHSRKQPNPRGHPRPALRLEEKAMKSESIVTPILQ